MRLPSQLRPRLRGGLQRCVAALVCCASRSPRRARSSRARRWPIRRWRRGRGRSARSCAAWSARTNRSTIPAPTSRTICACCCASASSPATPTQQAIQYIVARYGQFVLLQPPVEPATYVLWFGPAALLLVAGVGVLFYLRRRPRTVASPAPLSEAERTRVDELLREGDADAAAAGAGACHGDDARRRHRAADAEDAAARPSGSSSTAPSIATS